MIASYRDSVAIDIGTGDGRFVYQSARRNPETFHIGLDASPRPLEKISERVYRRPTKGGLSNALFIQAAVEDLPPELHGIASELHVIFPWGSLLSAVAKPDIRILLSLRRLCLDDARLTVIIGIDPERDRAELSRLGLGSFSEERIDRVLAPAYRRAGFRIFERGPLASVIWRNIESSWARRLSGNEGRLVFQIRAQATQPENLPGG